MTNFDDEIRKRAEQLDELVDKAGDRKPWLLTAAAFIAGGATVWLIGWVV